MQLVMNKADFSAALKVAGRGVKSRSPLPVTHCVRIRATETGATVPVSLFATDCELAVYTQFYADVQQVGEVCVPAKRISEITQSLSAKTLKLKCSPELAITVSSGKSLFRMTGIEATELPTFPSVADETGLTLPEGLLRRLVAQVVYAASKNETRIKLTGVCLTVKENVVELAATDAMILAVARQDLDTDFGRVLQVIIPRDAVLELLHLAREGSEEPADLWIDDNQIAFHVGDHWLFSRLIDGPYIDYEKLMPRDSVATLVFNREELIASLKRIHLIAAENYSRVTCHFHDNIAFLKTSCMDESVEEEVPIQHYGEPMKIDLNSSQLLSILDSFEGEMLTIRLESPVRPIVVFSTDLPLSFAVNMPMNPL